MVNPFQAVCNEQMAFTRYYLQLLGEKSSRLSQRAHLQALLHALHQSVVAYASELAFTLLRRSDAVISIRHLLELASKQGVVSSELTELKGLCDLPGSWLEVLEEYCAQSAALTLFDGQGGRSEGHRDATLIASSRAFSEKISRDTGLKVYTEFEELVQRQRSHNVEC